MSENVIVAMEQVGTGYVVDSKDLPNLNLLMQKASRLIDAKSSERLRESRRLIRVSWNASG